MSAYSKEFKGTDTAPNTKAPLSSPSSSSSGIVRIDPSMFAMEQPAITKSSGFLRDLEGLCFAMREMEITIGKERNRNAKFQNSLRDSERRINELNGVIENLRGEIQGQQAKEHSFLDQIRLHSQKISGLKSELESAQKLLSDQRSQHILESESLKIVIQNEKKKYQVLESEFGLLQRESEKRLNHSSQLQKIGSSIQEQKLQAELAHRINIATQLQQEISDLKSEISRVKSEGEKEQAKLLRTSLELRKALGDFRNSETELKRYKVELGRAREKIKAAEAGAIQAKQEALASAKNQLRNQTKEGVSNDVASIQLFISKKDQQISSLNQKLGAMPQGQGDKQKVEEIINLMIEQRDKLHEIATEMQESN